MNERVFPTKIYTFKGLRRTYRGSINLMTKGINHYYQEEGFLPTSVMLSTQRKETLPEEPAQKKYPDGTEFMYSFSDELQLNQIQCSRRDSTLDLSSLEMRMLAVHVQFTAERMAKEIFDERNNRR